MKELKITHVPQLTAKFQRFITVSATNEVTATAV